MKDKRTLLTIFLLILVLILGGATIFLAIRISTPAPIAPTAPEQPQAFIPEEGCLFTGGECTTSAACTSQGGSGDGQRDCSTGLICCKKGWSTCNDMTFSIACLPRPACLDAKDALCMMPEPQGGWCPYLVCDQRKSVFKDDPRNVPGTYYPVDKISEGGTVYQGQTIVFSVPYTNKSSKKIDSATVVDTLDPRLTFVDADPRCKYSSTGSKITCNIGVVEPNAGAQLSYRVKVKTTATLGNLSNTASLTTNLNSVSLCHSTQTIQPEPKADVICTAKKALSSVEATETLDQVTVGDAFVYSFDIENKGNADSRKRKTKFC